MTWRPTKTFDDRGENTTVSQLTRMGDLERLPVVAQDRVGPFESVLPHKKEEFVLSFRSKSRVGNAIEAQLGRGGIRTEGGRQPTSCTKKSFICWIRSHGI